ncbi:N-acetylmuramate alpha-1-phosphate uridylyltransferase MurU [Pusillimonas minor]|uniref:Nucleotidyltransferase family protein n=1 Tax=Pusillimonas minor TaxID=2697024 RepID=A0A842HPX9_9BURK|nr:nucleotidyltransferase family protein [Pusillimonas minor]MBC2770377.1 nucleotidyltransferase family protein [Pusillimonas minor]
MRAMILAAGRGERMRPLTDHTPKPLLSVAGKPLIQWHIERLVSAGITQIVINHAWLGHKIEAALGSGQALGAQLQYSPEPTALETAGGIAKALPLLGNGPFLVVNGDVWCNWPFGSAQHIANQLSKQNKLAWLLLVNNPDHHPQGDFYLETNGHIRPDPSAGIEGKLTFSGIGAYAPELFSGLPVNHPAPLAPLLRAAMSKQQVIGTHYNGPWVDVGTPERLAALEQQLVTQPRG